MGDYTKKHADLFGGNVKQISRVITPSGSAQFIGALERKFTILAASFLPDATGTSPVGTMQISRGAASASLVVACADSATQSGAFTAGTPKFYRTMTAANVDGARQDIVSAALSGASGTWPAGTLTVYYVDRDVDPNP